MKPVEEGCAPPGWRLDGAALWRACGVTGLQAARESNPAARFWRPSRAPALRDLRRNGLRAPVIAIVVGHHRELPTCARAASVSGRTCTLSLMVRSHALYLLSYRDIEHRSRRVRESNPCYELERLAS